jgi:hypothetical protein
MNGTQASRSAPGSRAIPNTLASSSRGDVKCRIGQRSSRLLAAIFYVSILNALRADAGEIIASAFGGSRYKCVWGGTIPIQS